LRSTASASVNSGSSFSTFLGFSVLYISCIDFGLLAHLNGLHFRMGLFMGCLKTKVLSISSGFGQGLGKKKGLPCFFQFPPFSLLLFFCAMNVHVWRG